MWSQRPRDRGSRLPVSRVALRSDARRRVWTDCYPYMLPSDVIARISYDARRTGSLQGATVNDEREVRERRGSAFLIFLCGPLDIRRRLLEFLIGQNGNALDAGLKGQPERLGDSTKACSIWNIH